MRIATGLALIFCVHIISSAAVADLPTSTVAGVLELHSLNSVFLKSPRMLRVWLPPSFVSNPPKKYAVLYMHDGQNLFDKITSAFGHEWEIDETLTKLINVKTIPPLIVVGIDNGKTERINEYTYAPHPKHGGGHADVYAKFLLEEVKPFIEKTYPVTTDAAQTYIGGSSLGALVSLEIARRHPHVFGGVLAMSPSLWWPTEPVADDIAHDPSSLVGTRIWIDMGTQEDSNAKAVADNSAIVEDAEKLSKVFEQQHIEHRLMIEKDANHNEIAWARRFPRAVVYLMTGK